MSCKGPHTAGRMTALLTKRGPIEHGRISVVTVVVYRCGCTRKRTVGHVITDEQLQKIDARFA